MGLPVYLPYEVKTAMIEVCGRAFYYKGNLFDVLARAGVPEDMFRRYESDAKFVIARNVIRELEQMGEEGKVTQRRLLTELSSFRSLPDAAADPDSGLGALRRLKELAAQHDLLVQKERDEARRRQEEARRSQAIQREAKLKELYGIFCEMASSCDHQARGYDLERLLSELFPLFGLEYRPPYRTTGEQIDGSFHFRGFDYIVESRWRQDRATLANLLEFKGKVDRKIESTRGLFLSILGFMPDAPDRLRQAGSANLILIDGGDLTLILEGRIGLVEALEAKADKAYQEGRLFYSLGQAINAGERVRATASS